MKVYIKVCCIADREEAKLAIQSGASAVGLVGAMPSGPGVITDTQIQDIARTVPPPVATFLLSSAITAKDLIDHIRRTQANTLQIVDLPHKNEYRVILEQLPWLKLVQVIHVVDDRSIAQAIEVSSHVDALLLDSGNPHLPIKELGGTGRTHNWDISRQIVQNVHIPVFLAGGLNAENIKDAIQQVSPFGVDICSGVRTKGILDPQKLHTFVQAVRDVGV